MFAALGLQTIQVKGVVKSPNKEHGSIAKTNIANQGQRPNTRVKNTGQQANTGSGDHKQSAEILARKTIPYCPGLAKHRCQPWWAAA